MLPYHYRALAVAAFNHEELSEGHLTQLLRTDRVSARAVVEAFMDREDIDDEGNMHSIVFNNLSQPVAEAEEVEE